MDRQANIGVAMDRLDERVGQARRHWFFPAIATALIVLVMTGFSRTFYFRAHFGTAHLPVGARVLPSYIYVHGAVLSLWFLLFFTQTALIRAGRTSIHRRLGIASAAVAAVLILITAYVLIGAIARSPANGLPADQIPLIEAGDCGVLVSFAVLIATAIFFRRRPETHKRLMLLASISIVGPAASRLPDVFQLPPGMIAPPVVIVGIQLSLMAAIVLHDVLSTRRVYRATALGIALILVMGFISSVVGFSQTWRSIFARHL